MPQNRVPLAIPFRPVRSSAVQEQINLGAGGMVAVGNPGGPIVFANFGQMIVPALYGSTPRSIVGQR